MSENKERKNPFFFPYDTDFEEAFMEGIRREDEQIEKLINDSRKPTFDNTIISIDDEKDGEGYYDLLGRVSSVFFNLLSAETNDDMDALAQKLSPILTKHANDIRLNERLFERVKYVHLHHRHLTSEEKMLLDNCYDGFVRVCTGAAASQGASATTHRGSCYPGPAVLTEPAEGEQGIHAPHH